jgi:hypothetical protein
MSSSRFAAGVSEYRGPRHGDYHNTRIRDWRPFHETLAFFNHELSRPVVLGGGCIRDIWIDGPELIKDYDVWVLGVQESEISDLDLRLSEAMHNFCARGTCSLASAGHLIGDYPGVPRAEVGLGAARTNRVFHVPKVNAKLPWVSDDKFTQLMYSPCETMQELVDQFDWRVCSFGFDGETVITSGSSDFEEHTLTLNDTALLSARSTLRRGFRLEEKFRGTAYHLNLPNETILALAAMLTLSG